MVLRIYGFLLAFLLSCEISFAGGSGYLKNLSVSEKEGQVRIIIEGSEGLSVICSDQNDPPRYTVRLPGLRSGPERKLVVKKDPVERISVTALKEKLIPVTLVEVFLYRETRPNVEIGENTVVLEFPVVKAEPPAYKEKETEVVEKPDKEVKEKKEEQALLKTAKNVPLRILVTRNLEEAEDALNEIAGGKTFSEIARERSIDIATRGKGGYLGLTDGKNLLVKVRETLKGLAEGEVSGAIPIENGRYAIIQIPDMRFFRAGMGALKRNDLQRAEESFKKHIELNPDGAKSYILLGKIHEGRGDLNEALKMYRTSLRYERSEETEQRINAITDRMKRFHQ